MLNAQTIAATKPPLKTKESPTTQAVAEARAATVICLTQILRSVNNLINQEKNAFTGET
jgi:hypothetical protein